MLKSSTVLTCWGLLISMTAGQQGLYKKTKLPPKIKDSSRQIPFRWIPSKDIRRLPYFWDGEDKKSIQVPFYWEGKDSTRQILFRWIPSKDIRRLPYFWDGKDEKSIQVPFYWEGKDSTRQIPFRWIPSKDIKRLPYFWDGKDHQDEKKNRKNHALLSSSKREVKPFPPRCSKVPFKKCHKSKLCVNNICRFLCFKSYKFECHNL